MTDQQILTIAISVIIPISVMIYSNRSVSEVSKRIDDSSKNANDRFDALAQKIDNLSKHLDDKIDNAFDHMKLLLELHEAKHHRN